MNAKKIFDAIVIGVGVTKSLATGKVADSLNKIEAGVQIAKTIGKILKPSAKKK